jgi:hypothetical protein
MDGAVYSVGYGRRAGNERRELPLATDKKKIHHPISIIISPPYVFISRLAAQ